MLKQIVSNYDVVNILETKPGLRPEGGSASPMGLIFHILDDKTKKTEVLDIGFGVGNLGNLIKSDPTTSHWEVDGIDGWDVNCGNQELFNKKLYRNIWHGLAQELPFDTISSYKIICLLDVIEHLNIETSKWLLRTLLSCLGDGSYLFISTPLWFYIAPEFQQGDMEEHLIGVPASSIMALVPKMYAISNAFIGGFVLTKESLDYVEFFQPTMDKKFSKERGMKVAKSVGMQCTPNMLYKL